MIKENKWFKVKGYIHIGLPLTYTSKVDVVKKITNPETVSQHLFLPFIRRTMITKPFKKKGQLGLNRFKKRNLTYASHFDAQIFAYYAEQLQKEYEKFIKKEHLDNVAVAYRKIPKTKGNRVAGKCNIDIANEVFDFIKKQLNDNNNVDVITFDIKGFFDNLDHKVLKKAWKDMLHKEKMEDDLYNVYKHVTKYSYVLEDDLFELFHNKIICHKSKRNKEIVNRNIRHKEFLREHCAIAYCRTKDMSAIRNKGIIKCNIANKGIPQGLPISAVLANIYMAKFDCEIYNSIEDHNKVMYVRYSDDIIVVCPYGEGEKWKKKICDRIKEDDVKLQIQQEKTNLYHFLHNPTGNIICKHELTDNNTKLEYLGFCFDGEHKLLKNSSVGKFYSRFYKSAHRSMILAMKVNNKDKYKLFTPRILRRYTYIGSPIRIKGTYHKSKEQQNTYPKKIFFGNFFTYVKKAEKIMGQGIKRQLRRSHSIVKKEIEKIKKVLDSKKAQRN